MSRRHEGRSARGGSRTQRVQTAGVFQPCDGADRLQAGRGPRRRAIPLNCGDLDGARRAVRLGRDALCRTPP